MRTKVKILLLTILVLMLFGCGENASQTNPNVTGEKIVSFSEISKENIKEVEITCKPPENTSLLSDKQITEFLDILKKIELKEKVSEEILTGQSILCRITNKDGSTHTINVMNPYIVVDEVWYKVNEENNVAYDELEAFVDRI